jgi:hypothetical protein
VPARPYLAIPAALRRRCGLEPGDRILLAVFPSSDALAAYSFTVVDQALRKHAPFPLDGQSPVTSRSHFLALDASDALAGIPDGSSALFAAVRWHTRCR